MTYDYSQLRGRIIEKCGTQGEFAKKMNISEHTMTQKLKGRIAFNQREITKAIVILGLSTNDIPSYFFGREVQRIEHSEA